jgi:hypothetical protein
VYGVIGEDPSDVEALANIIKRLAKNDSLTVRRKGFTGCGELLNRGADQLSLFQDLDCSRFVACYDADGDDVEDRRAELIRRVFKPAALRGACCAIVPVHMLEAWILADLPAIGKVVTGWAPPGGPANPEGIRFPKKHIEDLSEKHHRPRYKHKLMNGAIAKHLNLETVLTKCPSFRPLHSFVTTGRGNVELK